MKRGQFFLIDATMSGNKRDLRERRGALAKRPRKKWYTLAMVLLLSLTLTACVFGGAEQQPPQEEEQQPSGAEDSAPPAEAQGSGLYDDPRIIGAGELPVLAVDTSMLADFAAMSEQQLQDYVNAPIEDGSLLEIAGQYVAQRAAGYYIGQGQNYVDGEWQWVDQTTLLDFQVNGMERIGAYELSSDQPLYLYELDYRLLFADPEQIVMAGSPWFDEQGWFHPSYGPPKLLLTSEDQQTYHYLNQLANDVGDFSFGILEALGMAVNYRYSLHNIKEDYFDLPLGRVIKWDFYSANASAYPARSIGTKLGRDYYQLSVGGVEARYYYDQAEGREYLYHMWISEQWVYNGDGISVGMNINELRDKSGGAAQAAAAPAQTYQPPDNSSGPPQWDYDELYVCREQVHGQSYAINYYLKERMIVGMEMLIEH